MDIDVAPVVGHLMGYRSLWALAETYKHPVSGQLRLRATHYCYCALMGPSPMWGLYTVTGQFVRFYEKIPLNKSKTQWKAPRAQIEDAFPKHTWRRIAARWTYNEMRPKENSEERKLDADAFFKAGAATA